MPGLITHYICGEAVLNKLPDDIKKTLQDNRLLYNVGTQGPDIFFYSLSCLLRKKLAGLGSKMHSGQFNAYLNALLDSAKTGGAGQTAALAAYLSGYITHYALDSSAHPYIYYKSGFKRDGERGSRLKYSVNHHNFETAVDVLLLKLVSSEKPSDKKLWQLIRVTQVEAAHVAEHISQAIDDAYQVPISPRQVYGAMSSMSRATRLLQSKTGRRKRFIELAEDISIGDRFISSLIHPQEITDGIDYLNVSKKPWCLPWDNTRQYDLSFVEMFEHAVAGSVTKINALFDYLDGKMEKNALLFLMGNNSFATGIDAGEAVRFQYHE